MKTINEIEKDYIKKFSPMFLEIARLADRGDDTRYGKKIAEVETEIADFLKDLITARDLENSDLISQGRQSMLEEAVDKIPSAHTIQEKEYRERCRTAIESLREKKYDFNPDNSFMDIVTKQS